MTVPLHYPRLAAIPPSQPPSFKGSWESVQRHKHPSSQSHTEKKWRVWLRGGGLSHPTHSLCRDQALMPTAGGNGINHYPRAKPQGAHSGKVLGSGELWGPASLFPHPNIIVEGRRPHPGTVLALLFWDPYPQPHALLLPEFIST